MAGKDNTHNAFTGNATTTGESNTTYKYAAFLPIPVVLSLILFLIGFVTPGWSGAKIEGTFYGSGLWYDYVCHAGSDCETKPFAHKSMVLGDELAEAVEKSVLKYRVMACLALAFQIFATILTLLARVPKANFKQYLFTFTGICGLCLFLSALFSLVTSGMHVHQIIKAYKVYKKYIYLFEEMPFIFPYSLFLFGIGGIISALTMCFIMGTFCSKRMPINGPTGSTILMS